MINRTHLVRAVVGLVGAGALGIACASQPPRELVAARTAFATASAGGAAELAPAQLEAARASLQQAELWYAAHGGDHTTRELAADATAHARAAAQDASSTASQREQASSAAIARERAAAAQANASAERERAARTAAEQRERAAMDSLRQVAMVREEQRGVVITLSGEVLFPSGQSTLLPIARDRLDQVAQALRDYNTDQTFTVEGYTDSRGGYATNAALSQARAQAVLDYLVSRGVPASRIRAAGYGPDRPVADNATPEGRANNRRVEIVVHPAAPASSVGGGP